MNLFKPHTRIYIFATIISIVLSLVAIFYAGAINPDGILYIRVAQTWEDLGIQAALQQYSWPFYSILIALVNKILPLSLETSAYVLNIFLQIIITLYFIRIIAALGGNRRTQWFALFVIALFPYLIDYRSFIIRDFGYWAGYLAGLYYLICYCQDTAWKNCYKTVFALAAASLFRIEGMLFLLLTPLVFLIMPHFNPRKQHFFRFFAVTFMVIAFGLFITWLAIGNIKQLFHQWYFLGKGLLVLQQSINAKIAAFANLVLNDQSRRSASLIIITGLIGYSVVKLIKIINPLYLLLIAFALYRKLMPASRSQVAVLIYFFLINIVVISYFTGIFFFLTGRYCLAMAMIALLWVPFALDYLFLRIFAYHRHQIKTTQKFLFIILIAAMSVIGLHNYIQGDNSKRYLHQAGDWLANNMQPDQMIITNSAPVLFYAKGSDANWQREYNLDIDKILAADLSQVNYLALRINKHNQQQINEISIRFADKKPPLIFRNGKREMVIIYRL